MSRWWRAYDEAVDDPKLCLLNDRQHRAWFNLMCVASAYGGVLPDAASVAFKLRIKPDKAAKLIKELLAVGLIDETSDGTLAPHNWSGRQFQSDGSADRVARYRQRRKENGLPTVSDYTQFRTTLTHRDGELCVYCAATERLVVDHMVPIAMGGTDDVRNLALACKACNAGKAGRTPELAGMTVCVTSAAKALMAYRDSHEIVTVTVTPPEAETEAETEAERRKEPALRAVAVRESAWDFEEFWRQFPNKVGKPHAEKCLRRIEKSGAVTLAELMAGLARYAAKTDDRPWCNPSTWLNQARWADQPAAVQRRNGNGNRTVQDAASDLVERVRQLDRPLQFGGSEPASPPPIRLLPPR